MKNVIISADGDRIVYSVPNIVADNLTEYCIEFCDKWLKTSPHAKKYRFNGGLCYNERCTSQQKLDTNFKYYLSINLISVQYGASFATFLSG